MVITVYISGISGNKEVKKRQQRVQMILESKNVEYEAIDIAEPGRQVERDRVKHCGANQPSLPPQLFNGDDYCGDYDQFDLANETDELEKFLKLPVTNNISNSTNDIQRISPVKENSEIPNENIDSNIEENNKEESPKPKEDETEVVEVEEEKPADEAPAEENNITESKDVEEDETTENPENDEE